jgi:DNA ligase-1
MSATAATLFSDLASLVLRLTSTSKRLEKRTLVAAFLRALRREEIAPAVLILTGSIFAESDSRVMNLGYAAIQNVLASLGTGPPSGQPLTLIEVQTQLHAIAEVHGTDSIRRRQSLLQALAGRATLAGREVLVRALSGELRIGLSEGGMLDAIAEASGIPAREVRAAQMFLGDLGRLAETAVFEGGDAIRTVGLQLLSPVKPMLADVAENLADVFVEHGNTTALEFKIDGARVQIHRLDETVRIFSRRLTDVTASLPEIKELARALPSSAFVVEGELFAIDGQGRPLPFQELMRRFRRVHGIEEQQQNWPLALRLFDILYLDGRNLMDAPSVERFAALEKLVPQELLVERRLVTTEAESASFLAEAMAAGHEGVMAKRLDAPYTAGKRGRNWLKIKPADTLDVVVLAAEWGHGRRQGVLSNYWLGVRDGEGWQMIGKTFKGLTDVERLRLMQQLLLNKASEGGGVVHVRPEVVIEITYNDVQRSPTYSSGFALRFARVTRIRNDKGPQDADTYQRVQELFAKQFERKGRVANGSSL